MTQTASSSTSLSPGSGATPDAQRLALIGLTGTGKTVLARALAQRLNIPHLELDALYWGPNWTVRPTAEFRAAVKQAIAEPCWIADGSHSEVRDIIWRRATTLIWLDYQLSVVMWQLFKRTSCRIIGRQELWSGNRETWRNHILSRRLRRSRGDDTLGRGTVLENRGGTSSPRARLPAALHGLLTYHQHYRQTFERLLAEPEHAHLSVLRLRSPQDAEQWLATVEHCP
jgi:adenylate kinase family enzyme